VFIIASLLMIWRLEHMIQAGVEGTVLGTLIMPYCSGLGNLIFTFVLARRGGGGAEVVVNALVNNVTNLTLLIALPALVWGLNLHPSGPGKARRGGQKESRLHRLSLLLTLTAVWFFTGAVWALGRDGRLDLGDGLVLVGLFGFWQCFHVFDVLKANVRQNRGLSWTLGFDLLLLLGGGAALYASIEGLVNWVSSIQTGFVSATHLGWLSGWLMVLPNALLALYYGWTRRPEIIYASQVGDGHICIPLCIGLYALSEAIAVPKCFTMGIQVLLAATLGHVLCVALLGRLPRWLALLFLGGYGYFLYRGLLR
jgi:cation:H+ antiporter